MTLDAPLQGTVPIYEVAEHLRVALDVRRLGREISLFWELRPEVAIHYSRSCMLQVPFELLGGRTTPFLQSLRAAYDAVRRLDAPLTFVSERQFLAGGTGDFKVILLPAVRYMPVDVFERVDGYLRGGGHLVVLPESLLADEYAHPRDYLAKWGIEVAAVDVPAIEGLGTAEQGYDQSFSREVRFGKGRATRATEVDADFFGGDVEVEAAGVFQEIVSTGRQALADVDGQPLIVRKEVDQGALYYFAGTPTPSTLRSFVDVLMERAGVYRPFRLSAPDGSRLPQVEARLAHTKYFDLVYLINEAAEPVEFRLDVDRPHARVRELRSLDYWEKPEGRLPARQTLIFKLMADPVEIGQGEEEPSYPYHGF